MPDGKIRRARLLRMSGKYPQVVFEGTLPQNNAEAADDELLDAVAWVADHVIVKPADNISEREFQRTLAAAGFQAGRKLSSDGQRLVQLPQAVHGGVDAAIETLRASGAVAYAEPDYLVFASEIPETRVLVDDMDGVATFPEAALDESTVPPPAGPVFHAAAQAAGLQERLLDLPPATRIITFDVPFFLGGPGSYKPYIEEQSFLMQTDGGMYIQNAYTAGYPNNGTYYARSSAVSEQNFSIRHSQGLPFAIHSVDLAEYSSLFATPKTLTFTGHKIGAGTITQSFVLDGVIDGTGPVEDFQRFVFDSRFTNLAKVTVAPGGFQIDNIAVQVDGQETPLPPPPDPPQVYNVTWDPPEHAVNALTAVGGPFAPTSINFGTPTVRAQIGTLPGPSLEFKGAGYQQIRFALQRGARSYRLEFNTHLDAAQPFRVHFDDAGGVQNLEFKTNGTIGAFQSFVTTPAILGYYPMRTNTHVAVDVDMVESQWRIFVNGVSQYTGPFNTSRGDLSSIRFHADNLTNGICGLDNVRIFAYGVGDAPIIGPRLFLSVPSMSFGSLPLGSSKQWLVSLQNSGGETLVINNISSDSIQFTTQGTYPVHLPPGGTYYASVKFAPQSVGTFTGNILIASNDEETPLVAVPVSGAGAGIPSVQLQPGHLFVNMLQDSMGTEVFTIRNTGLGSLAWNLVLKGGAVDNPGVPEVPPFYPDDPSFGSLWAMRSPLPGTGGIDAVRAWTITTGSAATAVAVIDTGVDRAHPELQGNIWTNPGEIPGNGIDDDGNGYIDDVHGWNFSGDTAETADLHGHGTHVAGTIAARGHNGLGIAGVCWRASIMPVKFLSDSGTGYTSDAVSAVSYATAMGARISNNSWGGGGYSLALYDAIRSAGLAGSLFVAAAGNSMSNNDLTPRYPAGYNLENILAVAATDSTDRLSYFSNFGASTVDLGAPGSSIFSLRPGGQYASMSGTSMAAPHVTGAAGLLLSHNPALSVSQIKALILFGVDTLASLSGSVESRGRLNAYRSLKSTVPQWLQPQVTSGTLAPGQSVEVPLSINTAGLGVGTHTQMIALSSNDPLRPVVDLPVNLEVMAPKGYHRWLFGSFGSNWMLSQDLADLLWSDSADPDKDGISNLLEYIHGADPTKADAHRSSRMVVVGGDGLFEFQVRDDLDGAGYQVEWTGNLDGGEWLSTGITVVENTTAGQPAGMRKLVVKLSAPPPGGAAFFRLRGMSGN
ncbi:MAG: S8 family serine peptidase [Chthoniobacterales bacterium]|nr:S8 family serine peptidase [Chthoniobacterales bacterium]